ncbi:MAG: hypothetical protein DBY02_01860 [Coprobacter fastidiosus]|nr:MAG: hypothetical protein DBY02_01860 [Coprobacter fastidiosus]
MKKTVYAMAAILLSLVGFTACSEDDDEKDVFDDVTTELTDDVIFSFSYDNATMFETATVEISLLKKENSTQSFTAPKDITFPIVVDETSTAVEGTHFEFDGEKALTVAKGASKGTLKLKLLQKEEGKDVIVLKIQKPQNDTDRFFLGNNESVTIKIAGETIEVLKGTWSNCTWDNKAYYEMSYDITNFPQVATEDQITITDQGVEVNLKSDLKNYFVGNSSLQYVGEKIFHFMEDFTITRNVAVFILDNINANFSATSSTIKDSRVGFTVVKDENNEEVLEMFIYSYEPTEFLVEDYEAMKDIATEDEPAMYYYPLRYHFKRVQ